MESAQYKVQLFIIIIYLYLKEVTVIVVIADHKQECWLKDKVEITL